MKPQCDEMCCNHGCNQGRDCPVRKGGTDREKFELEHFGIKPAKIGKRTPTFEIFQPSLKWRRTIRGWAKFWLGMILGFIAGPIVVGLIHVMGLAT